jgi:hypothetical protein
MGQRREPSFRVLLLLSCGTRVATPPSARQADLDVVGDTLPPLTRSTVCSAFHFSASDQSRRRREGDTDPSFLDLLAGRRHEHASALDPLGSSGGEGWAESAPGPHQGRHDASLPLLPQAADLLARRRPPAPMGTGAGHRHPALQPGSE